MKYSADPNKYHHIFTAGTYEQWNGEKFVKVTVTPDDLLEVAAAYDTNFHEAPLWIGHPTDPSAPALGWFGKLKAEGGKLYASFNYVSEKLHAMVNSKEFKKVSVEIYNWVKDSKKILYLGAVGLTNMPLVKSLPALSFTDNISLKCEGEKVDGGIMVCPNINLSEKTFKSTASAVGKSNNQNHMENEKIKKFAASIGLNIAEFDTEDQVLDFAADSINKLRKRFEDDPEQVGSLSMLITKYNEIADTNTALAASVLKLTEERNNLIIESAVKIGKIPPAKKQVYEELLKGSYEQTVNLINAIEPGKVLEANIVPGGGGEKIKDVTDDKFKAEDGKALTFKDYLVNVEKEGTKYAGKFTEDELKKLPGYEDYNYTEINL